MSIMTPQIEINVPLDQVETVFEMPGSAWWKGETAVDRASLGLLEASPFHGDQLRKRLAHYLRDLGNAFLASGKKELTLDELVSSLERDPDAKTALSSERDARKFIELCIRACVAQKGYVVRKHKQTLRLRLSATWARREAERQFAAGLAAELKALSSRMEQIVPHQGERGRFREDILRALLEKNLPSRYHVATGFIYGCSRQLDILIYDQVDYAPLFREEGVVVVPPEAVRAVIEVKTTLTKEELNDALGKLSAVAHLDDCSPPFFKGVFAFRGPRKQSTVTSYITGFYQPSDLALEEEEVKGDTPPAAGDENWEIEQPDGFEQESEEEDSVIADNMIMEPFQHLTCLCIDQRYVAEVALETKRTPNGEAFVPTIVVTNSKTQLAPSTALFVEALNQHLNVPTLKKRDTQLVSTMIGADLSPSDGEAIYEDLWGPYHLCAGGTTTVAEITSYLARLRAAVRTWRETGVWSEPLPRPW